MTNKCIMFMIEQELLDGLKRMNIKPCWICYLRLIYRLISNKSCFLQLIEPYYFVSLHGKSIDIMALMFLNMALMMAPMSLKMALMADFEVRNWTNGLHINWLFIPK